MTLWSPAKPPTLPLSRWHEGKACESGEEWRERGGGGGEIRGWADKGALAVVKDGEKLWRLAERSGGGS